MSDRKVKLKVSNYSDAPFDLYKGRHVGYIYRREESALTTLPPNVNALGHAPEIRSTAKGYQEKREFVIRQLGILTNKLLQPDPELQDQIVQVF